jgi:hypothetical protein
VPALKAGPLDMHWQLARFSLLLKRPDIPTHGVCQIA